MVFPPSDVRISEGSAGGGSGVTNNTILAEDSGTIAAGDFGVFWISNLPDAKSLELTQASFSDADGTPMPTGADLIIATLDGAGSGTSQVTVLSGDGSTVYSDQEGSPLASYTNSSGSAQTVAIGIDNGNFNSGSGNGVDATASAIGSIK